jgi:hypothetical protein
MKKLKMKHILTQHQFVELFKEYCETLGWSYRGDNPFKLLGKHQIMNPRVEIALMQFSQIIKDFNGDFVDLQEWYYESLQ